MPSQPETGEENSPATHFICTRVQVSDLFSEWIFLMTELKFSCKIILFSNLLDQIREKQNSGKVSLQQKQQNAGML